MGAQQLGRRPPPRLGRDAAAALSAGTREVTMIAGTRQLVHDTWAVAWPARDDLARHFYARLFEIDPDAARLFASTDMAAQRRKFTDMLATIVRAIDEPDELVPASAALGRRHAGYGVEERHYESVGDALFWALGQTLGDRYTPEAHAAWHEAYALLSALMRRGALSASGLWTAAREAAERRAAEREAGSGERDG